MSHKKYNFYTDEFKEEEAVKLALESNQPIAQAARELGDSLKNHFLLMLACLKRA